MIEIPPPGPTPVDEHEHRRRRLRAAMAAEHTDLLICYGDAWRTANTRYFTDFRPVDGIGGIEQTIVFFPVDGAPSMLVDDGCLDVARELTDFEVRPLSELAQVVRRHAAGSSPTSVRLAGREQIPAPVYAALSGAFGIQDLAPSTALAKVKAVKSAWEIEQLRYAAALTDVAVARMKEIVVAGEPISERDLAREADMSMIAAGADGPAYLTMVQSGPRSAFSLALPSHRLIQPGELVLTDVGARYGNYVADGGRGFTVGPVGEEIVDLVDASVSAVEAGLAFARPGITASELNSEIQSVLVDRGYADFSVEARGRGTGHGTGMDPEEHIPWIGPTNEDMLEPGMVFTLKATINKPGVGGLRTERIVYLTQEDARPLDEAPMRNHW